MVLGLRYIHKEVFVVHRDLTPNNIMLGEGDKVTISKRQSWCIFSKGILKAQIQDYDH